MPQKRTPAAFGSLRRSTKPVTSSPDILKSAPLLDRHHQHGRLGSGAVVSIEQFPNVLPRQQIGIACNQRPPKPRGHRPQGSRGAQGDGLEQAVERSTESIGAKGLHDLLGKVRHVHYDRRCTSSEICHTPGPQRNIEQRKGGLGDDVCERAKSLAAAGRQQQGADRMHPETL
jgi:hypothetical protein